MSRVVFVGDAPTHRNVNIAIPFVGTKSLDTLEQWILILGPTYYVCYNSWHEDDLNKIQILRDAGFKVIALGAAASTRLTKRGIEHFQLPHPSGLNRKLNDKKKLYALLYKCRDSLHSK